ncbi:MAG: hypothetical protein WKF59_08420 [Chitinophagaceae bacterium]
MYELGVQGIFTKTLDAALLSKRIDIAVHSMKDVPTQLAQGIKQAAVLKRGNHKDIFVPHPDINDVKSIFGMGVLEIVDFTITSGAGKTKEREKLQLLRYRTTSGCNYCYKFYSPHCTMA